MAQLREVAYAVVGIISKLRFAANPLTPVNRLPPEILCEVFFHLRPVIRGRSKQYWTKRQPFEDLLAVTITCQHWRATAITTPDLWSQLIIREPRSTFDDMARLFIDRSSELPLDADVRSGLAVVAPHTNRLRTLLCDEWAFSDYSNLINRPAPLLEHFTFAPTSSSPKFRPSRLSLTVSLRKLAVGGYKPWPNNHFGGLSSLHLELTSKCSTLALFIVLLAILQDSPQFEKLLLPERCIRLGTSRCDRRQIQVCGANGDPYGMVEELAHSAVKRITAVEFGRL